MFTFIPDLFRLRRQKTVKNLPALRKIFEELKVLGENDPLNLALVVPFHEIDTPVTVDFEGENVENKYNIRQWKVSVSG